MNKLKIFLIFVLRIPNNLYNGFVFNIQKVECKTYTICGRIFVRNQGKISLGSNFKGNSGLSCNPIGGDHILRLITNKGAFIRIGKNVGISNSTIYSRRQIIIEDGVLIGGGCKIWDTNFHSLNSDLRGTVLDRASAMSASILIKEKAFIGGNSIILKGVIIGVNSIVAAGSVVVKSIPDNEIWGGNPAKFIKRIK